MADKREQMLAKGILFPRRAGWPRNHTRLFMAVDRSPIIIDGNYAQSRLCRSSQQACN